MSDFAEFESKVDLPRGNWAELKDPYDITVEEREPLERSFIALSRAGTLDEKPGDVAVTTPVAPMQGGPTVPVESDEVFEARVAAMKSFERETILFFVASWSFDLDKTVDAIPKLPAAAYAAIDQEVGKRLEVLFPEITERRKKAAGNPTTP